MILYLWSVALCQNSLLLEQICNKDFGNDNEFIISQAFEVIQMTPTKLDNKNDASNILCKFILHY